MHRGWCRDRAKRLIGMPFDIRLDRQKRTESEYFKVCCMFSNPRNCLSDNDLQEVRFGLDTSFLQT